MVLSSSPDPCLQLFIPSKGAGLDGTGTWYLVSLPFTGMMCSMDDEMAKVFIGFDVANLGTPAVSP